MWKVRVELVIRVILWRIKIWLMPEKLLDEEERKVKEKLAQKRFKKFTCGM